MMAVHMAKFPIDVYHNDSKWQRSVHCTFLTEAPTLRNESSLPAGIGSASVAPRPLAQLGEATV